MEPRTSEGGQERRLAAILSIDAVGYSRLMARDDAGTVRQLSAAHEVMRSVIESGGGRVVDAPGDNLLAEFPSVVRAVECAVEIQRELVERAAAQPVEERMLFRAGVHIGDVIVEGDRVYGHGVNVAARLEALAEPGGVCLSGTAFEQVEGKLSVDFEFAGEHWMKNLPKPVPVHRCLLSKILRFGEFELDEDRGELRASGEAVDLKRKPLQLLAYLARQHGRWVPKDELFASVWPDAQVSDAALFSALRDARRALGDDGRRQRWIQTERRRGFRLVMPSPAPTVTTPPRQPAGDARPGLVGRSAALAELAAALEQAMRGQGRMLLLAGEAGIGKTRLAQEVARGAEQRGLLVLWGRCWDGEGAPSLWPWIGVLRAAFQGAAWEAVARQVGPQAEWVSHLLPELRGASDASTLPLDSPDARFLVFDAVTRMLSALAAATPLVVVLDDLHWADPASLELLRVLATQLRGARLLVIGTYRDVEVREGHPMASTLPQVLREDGVARRPLAGLAPEDTAALVRDLVEHEPDPDFARALHDRTLGNPLFVEQTIGLLRESLTEAVREGAWTRGRSLAALEVPDAIRHVIERRVAALPDPCPELLRAAAVVGPEFETELLARLLETPLEEAEDALARAVSARLIDEPQGSSGLRRFTHPLIRETLYTGLVPPRRRELHGAVAAALEALHASDPDPPFPALAHHFDRSGAGATEQALAYAQRAAGQSFANLAYEDAARHFARALQLQEQEAASDARLRCELLLGLGESELRGDRPAAAQDTFGRALELAHTLREPELLARVAIGLESARWVGRGATLSPHVPLLEKAVLALGERDLALRSRLLARLAFALTGAGDARSEEAARDAVAAARASGDAAALSFALGARHWALWSPRHLAERLEVAREMRATAERSGDTWTQELVSADSFIDALQQGDLSAVEEQQAASLRLTGVLRMPWRAAIARVNSGYLDLLQGRLAKAGETARWALEEGERLRSRNVSSGFLMLNLGLRLLQGQLEALLPETERSEFRRFPAARAARLLALQEAGRDAEAYAGLAAMVDRGLLGAAANHAPLVLALLAELAIRLGDASTAARLAPELRAYLPYNLAGAWGFVGSSFYWVGRLAHVQGDLEEALGLLEQAAAAHRSLAALPWLAWTQLAEASVLLDRGGPDDAAHAAALLDEACAAARRLDLPGLEARARAVAGGASTTD
jgi:class 3 adenylate cyclase/tetratricopeptide (TPR) repeat protein